MFKTKEELIKEADLDDNNEFTDGYNLGFEEGLGVSFESFAERVEFYKKYRSNPISLKIEYPNIYDTWNEIFSKKRKVTIENYNNWLFDHCFGDIK